MMRCSRRVAATLNAGITKLSCGDPLIGRYSLAAVPVPVQKTRRVVTLAQELPSLMRRDNVFARAPQQRALFELLEQLGGRAAVEQLLERTHFSPSVLKGLVARGLVTVEQEVVARDPFLRRAPGKAADHVPTPAQVEAITQLTAAQPGEVFLLHGVTGSGKTLVYIELLREIVDRRGRSAIVLVPEIALTPQTVDRFRAVFGDRIAVLHSALSDGERYDAWLALQRGEKRIAVGARSAVFAPLPDLGAIIVDEEHESSYKQGEAPRYHARETAIVRARLDGAVVGIEQVAGVFRGTGCHGLSLVGNDASSRAPATHLVGERRHCGGEPSRLRCRSA